MYECQIENCENKVQIRTKIKNRDSEFYGKSVCPSCALKHNEQKEKKIHVIPQTTTKTVNERKEVRKDYSKFFQKHIQLIKEGEYCCEECGDRLFGEVSEIAHLVKKSTNNEIGTNNLNIVYLCGRFSENRCHAKFDSNFENRNSMNVFKIALDRFKQIRDEIVNVNKEVLNYEDHLI